MQDGDAAPAVRDSITLSDVVAAIARNKILVILCTLIGAGAALILATRITDVYTADATMVSDASLARILDPERGDAVSLVDPSSTATVVETLGSAAVVERAIAQLPSETVAGLRANLPPAPEGAEDAPAAGAAVPNAEMRKLVKNVSQDLKVSNSGRSYVIYVSYTSEDPALAAAVPNAVTQAYLDYRSDIQRESYEQWLARIETEIAELRDEMRAAERTAQEMRERARLLSLRSESLVGDQQNAAVEENSKLFARQREAEREAQAVAEIHAGLLRTKRDIETRLDWPSHDVRLFAAATVPLDPSGQNIKPVLLVLGTVGGFLLGATLAFARSRRGRARRGARA